ncbi:MAG TPA: hypothetical protein VMF69_14180 [Gemmataceae bacterium]|nr:hypothetical protein [Gemmataceae bacterium]
MLFDSWKCARFVLILLVCLLLPACKSKVNKANFDKVKDGMTLEEVEKILGKGSKETGDGSNVAAQFGVALPAAPISGGGDVYTWESGDNTIRLTFRSGKLVHKQATGF